MTWAIRTLINITLALLLTGCYPATQCEIAPTVVLVPQQRNVDCLPSAFDKLTPQELEQDWAKELLIGETFAKEFDLYRAITSFKRASILIPKQNQERLLQIEYSIIESYYLGQKYQEVIDTFEKSPLLEVTPDFPAFGQLLIMLQDSYFKLGLEDKASRLLGIIEQGNRDVAHKLKTYAAVSRADLCRVQELGELEFLTDYALETKSVGKARMLNAILPGAGYYYVGQKKSALTSFVINSLFIAAAYQFFDRGYYAAGAITTSLEMGWYFGGINGAGIEAKEYNERLYETKAKNFLIKQGMFPILLFETSF